VVALWAQVDRRQEPLGVQVGQPPGALAQPADLIEQAVADQVAAVQRPSWVIPRIESVGEWLDEHEQEHAGLTPLQEEFKRYLGQEESGAQKD
jgi:hypothetical protein